MYTFATKTKGKENLPRKHVAKVSFLLLGCDENKEKTKFAQKTHRKS